MFSTYLSYVNVCGCQNSSQKHMPVIKPSDTLQKRGSIKKNLKINCSHINDSNLIWVTEMRNTHNNEDFFPQTIVYK